MIANAAVAHGNPEESTATDHQQPTLLNTIHGHVLKLIRRQQAQAASKAEKKA
jgi:hypothetical protein